MNTLLFVDIIIHRGIFLVANDAYVLMGVADFEGCFGSLLEWVNDCLCG